MSAPLLVCIFFVLPLLRVGGISTLVQHYAVSYCVFFGLEFDVCLSFNCVAIDDYRDRKTSRIILFDSSEISVFISCDFNLTDYEHWEIFWKTTDNGRYF